ncbi:helix-turn-helix transcriptional regulator [Yersinia enterocolitica]|uniref:Putative transcription regulator PA1347 n=1 Tax=Yersinia enterocolitica subsp. palearctica serotype O:3 (strain DSM 13030 / CIP 106945 / Y11) TaxID=930944 RepID=A0A0H3NWQ3_YERE1|nr:helix-turn-helix transcriptional regulator [Yersinia enterocolitica]EKN3315344.1 helix-turn-helix transcriptional regulator [Yersinia enterocolitica]EKN3319108.1 helix-turn-helix transcriptional regulator [Yersinia enterocolitica]EKN3323151.1 helix-turn-helix transcriptional regulator [Yersinia enterocolitica]EKN3335012.1 helix-turn-helix transcriptional regulator [Yersinia enterocolitica]EKN3355059.1 helix-turn-helix transcriptional regulator [Yersinia enterocolitica]
MEASLFNSLQLLIRFWENSSEPWGVKDNQSRYVYANNRLHRLLALPDKFNMEGRTDVELPTPIAEFELEFQEHDCKVKLLQDRITSVEIHAWDGRSYYQPYFVDKYPLMDENGISQGVICHGRPVEDIILTHINKIKVPTSLILTPPSDLFSKRDWEVLFYILHSFSSMEVATKLHLSSRTIDNITQKIYKKIGISGRQQLVDYCYENKINNYVPQSFFEYSGAFPLI